MVFIIFIYIRYSVTEAVWNKTAKSSPETICLNGGYELSDQTSTCVCPPGFKGQFCEQGTYFNNHATTKYVSCVPVGSVGFE